MHSILSIVYIKNYCKNPTKNNRKVLLGFLMSLKVRGVFKSLSPTHQPESLNITGLLYACTIDNMHNNSGHSYRIQECMVLHTYELPSLVKLQNDIESYIGILTLSSSTAP